MITYLSKMQPKDFKYNTPRYSHTSLNEVYFWTTTVNKWQHLLQPAEHKIIIINSLQWLVQKELIKLYGFVVMPNHVHLMWEQLKMNGKELPKNSFEKFTAKTFLHLLETNKAISLQKYSVSQIDREYSIWQRDPIAIKIFNKEMAAQKLDYMHLNPLQSHWLLSDKPEQYRFSSAKFYESGVDEFNILTHFGEVF